MSDHHPFITEQIVPNKKKKRKKLFHSLETAAFSAVVFGFIGSFTFALSRPYFEKVLNHAGEPPISFTTEAPLPTETPAVTPPPVSTPLPTQTPVSEPAEVAFPKIETAQVQEFYQVLSETAESFNHSIVTVSGVLKGVDWFDNPSELSDASSGLLIAGTETELYLLSAFHRISDAGSIRVTFSDETTVNAQLKSYDKDTNLAVLSIAIADIPSKLLKTLTLAEFGDSYYAQPGTPVLALGSPNGTVYSMDFGIVSGKATEQYITDNKLELFQTSMTASENGEGVIVDLDGRVLGIITHSSDTKSSFCTAMGITRLKSLIEKLVNSESRACLGVIANDIPEEYKESLSIENGIYISTVNNNSPALDAGLKSGDVILKIDEHEVSTVTMLNNLLSGYAPKDSVTLSIFRTSKTDNKEMKVEVTLGKR